MHPLPEWAPLSRATAATRELFAASAQPLSLSPGECLFEAGAPAEHLFLIQEGVLRVFHAKDPDTQFTVKLLRGPVEVGVTEAVRRSPWFASVEVLGRAEGVRIPAERLDTALAKDPGFALAVLSDVSEKFAATIQMSCVLGFDDCNTRLARILLEYAEQFGRPDGDKLLIRFALSRERLSREIGAARRSVDRGLEKLAKEALVSLSPRGWLWVHSLDRLRELVASHSATPVAPLTAAKSIARR